MTRGAKKAELAGVLRQIAVVSRPLDVTGVLQQIGAAELFQRLAGALEGVATNPTLTSARARDLAELHQLAAAMLDPAPPPAAPPDPPLPPEARARLREMGQWWAARNAALERGDEPPPRPPHLAPSDTEDDAEEVTIERAPAASCRKAEHKALLRHCAAEGYKHNETAVLSVLWSYTGNKGNGAACYPKVGTIAKEARLSVRATQYALRGLAARGAVWIARPARGAARVPPEMHPRGAEFPDGQNAYLLTRYAAPEVLRAWALAARDGLPVDGAGQAPHAAPESAPPSR